ncbi:flavin reductase family protein [Microbacterium sp. LWH7-1.2]|uniref:flavin reductase family protein n=1 Tax=Microbacterium sp. LWH7-1.2 TaxID=3135257 RepID=UPI003139302D
MSDIAWNQEIYDFADLALAGHEPEAAGEFDVRAFRRMMGGFATGVVAVTYESDGQLYGMTANSFTSISLTPPLAMVSLMRSSRSLQYLLDRPFAINVLAAVQLDVALHFARKENGAEPLWLTDGRAPRLAGAVATMQCTPWAAYPAGDHILVLGRIAEFEDNEELAPLVYQRGSWTGLTARTAQTEATT